MREKCPESTPGLNFFGNLVDADMTLGDLERFLTVGDEFLQKSAKRLAGKYDRFGLDRSDAFTETFPEILYAAVVTAVVSFVVRKSLAQDAGRKTHRRTDSEVRNFSSAQLRRGARGGKSC